MWLPFKVKIILWPYNLKQIGKKNHLGSSQVICIATFQAGTGYITDF